MNAAERLLCTKTEEIRKQSIQQININNPDIVQDNADLQELEQRYEKLDISHAIRRVIDDYIACIMSRQERMESLIYYAGREDAHI